MPGARSCKTWIQHGCVWTLFTIYFDWSLMNENFLTFVDKTCCGHNFFHWHSKNARVLMLSCMLAPYYINIFLSNSLFQNGTPLRKNEKFLLLHISKKWRLTANFLRPIGRGTTGVGENLRHAKKGEMEIYLGLISIHYTLYISYFFSSPIFRIAGSKLWIIDIALKINASFRWKISRIMS